MWTAETIARVELPIAQLSVTLLSAWCGHVSVSTVEKVYLYLLTATKLAKCGNAETQQSILKLVQTATYRGRGRERYGASSPFVNMKSAI